MDSRLNRISLLLLLLTVSSIFSGTANAASVSAVLKNSEGPKAENHATSPNLMAAMGDSITAGFLASTSAPHQGAHVRPTASKHDLVKALIGENKETLSWSTGKDIDSQANLLNHYLGNTAKGSLDALNVAVSGNETSDIPRQAQEIADTVSQYGYRTLKYVTLLIGANDLCSGKHPNGVPPDVMKSNIERGLGILNNIHQGEPIHVMISSLPHIPDLARPEIANAITTFGFTCHKARDKILGFCGRMLSWTSEAEYNAHLAEVVNVNQMLQELAAESRQLYPQLQVSFSPFLFNTPIQLDMMAADCFHPNASGQKRISEGIWKDQSWFQ